MGLRLRGPVRCGGCGKPRGIRHVCVARIGSRSRRHKARSPITWECSSCHKARGLRHACGNTGDFKARKRRQAAAARQARRKEAAARRASRRKAAAADRRARDKARKALSGRKPRPSRPQGDGHEPGTCGNRDCQKFGCKAYFAGMANCPGPHDR